MEDDSLSEFLVTQRIIDQWRSDVSHKALRFLYSELAESSDGYPPSARQIRNIRAERT